MSNARLLAQGGTYAAYYRMQFGEPEGGACGSEEAGCGAPVAIGKKR